MKPPDAASPDLVPPEANSPAEGEASSPAPPPLTPAEHRARRIARAVTLVGALLAAAAATALFLLRGGPSLPPYAVVFAEGEAQIKGNKGPGVAPVRLAHGANVDLVLRPADTPKVAARVLVCADVGGALKPVDTLVERAASGALHLRVLADAILALPGTDRLWVIVAPADVELGPECDSPPSRAQMVLVKLLRE